MPSYLVDRLVPYVHVADVPASIAFYQQLGFKVENQMDEAGAAFWAFLSSGSAQIMLVKAGSPVVAEQQAVIFYMYSPDVAALREHLLQSGLADGGEYCGQQGPNGGRRVVFAVAQRDYMPGGEIRVADPDGYCILVGQRQ